MRIERRGRPEEYSEGEIGRTVGRTVGQSKGKGGLRVTPRCLVTE